MPMLRVTLSVFDRPGVAVVWRWFLGTTRCGVSILDFMWHVHNTEVVTPFTPPFSNLTKHVARNRPSRAPWVFGGATDISGKSHDYLCYILTLSSARFRVLTVSGVPVRSLLRVVGGGSDA